MTSGTLAKACNRSASSASDEVENVDWEQERPSAIRKPIRSSLGRGRYIRRNCSPISSVRPKVPADVGGEPEAVEAEGRDLQQAAAKEHTKEVGLRAGEIHADARRQPAANLRNDIHESPRLGRHLGRQGPAL